MATPTKSSKVKQAQVSVRLSPRHCICVCKITLGKETLYEAREGGNMDTACKMVNSALAWAKHNNVALEPWTREVL